MIPWIGPNESLSDGAGKLKLGNVGNGKVGNALTIGTGFGTGNATGIGKMIGDFFKFFKIAAVLAILATLIAFATLKAPNFNAIVFFATLIGAVKALIAAILAALA